VSCGLASPDCACSQSSHSAAVVAWPQQQQHKQQGQQEPDQLTFCSLGTILACYPATGWEATNMQPCTGLLGSPLGALEGGTPCAPRSSSTNSSSTTTPSTNRSRCPQWQTCNHGGAGPHSPRLPLRPGRGSTNSSSSSSSSPIPSNGPPAPPRGTPPRCPAWRTLPWQGAPSSAAGPLRQTVRLAAWWSAFTWIR